MCGLAAIFYTKPNPTSDQAIRKMTDLLAHRGPDAEGFYMDETVALGHRRLSIIDLSPLGAQPMWDVEGRYVVVFNGEIYNYVELKAELSEYPFRSTSDTEVLLAGYATWGTDLFKKLNGIFAFAIYDKQEQHLCVARDRFGVKPLYYAPTSDFCAIASEQRAIIHSNLIEKEISREAIADFFFDGAVCGTQRSCKGILQLPAGHYMTLHKGEAPKVQPYHFFFNNVAPPPLTDREGVKTRLHELLGQAVQRQMVSDVPLGAFLSGGIDSSAIVALMSEVATSQPLTFSIGFKEDKYDESRYAEVVAKKFNTNHTTFILHPDDFLNRLPAALRALDTPTLDGINTFVVSELTRNSGVTVALSGLGGDELFAGYPGFLRYYNWKNHFFWRLPAGMRRIAASAIGLLGSSTKIGRTKHLLNIPEFTLEHVYPLFRQVFDEETVALILGHTPATNPVFHFLQHHKAAIAKLPLLSQYTVGEMTGYTAHMLLKDTDQMSMASGLEVRVPFFDNDLVDYVLSIPDAVKYPHSPKGLLVESLGDLLPPEVVNRPKMGFVLPWEDWLRGELNSFCQQKIDALCDRNLLNGVYVKKMWNDFLHRQNGVLASHVWMFVVLEEWLEKNFDQD